VHGNHFNKYKAPLHTVAAVHVVCVLTFLCVAAVAGVLQTCGYAMPVIKQIGTIDPCVHIVALELAGAAAVLMQAALGNVAGAK